MKRIKIAQIGTSKNSHGNAIWNSLRKQEDLFDIAGYAFPENEREKFPAQAKAFEGYKEMTVEEILSDPSIEAVTVETEEVYLTKYACMAAHAGKHIHMEKPGSPDLAGFEDLIGTMKAKGLAFTTGYMYRFNPKIQEAREKIKSGALGEIYAVEAHMDCKHPPEVRQWLSNFPGGMMFFLGCHLVDLIYQIQGEPEEVIPYNCSTGYAGVNAEDYGLALFRYKNGVSFAKTIACENGVFLRRQLVICGTEGTIEIKPLEVLSQGGQYTVMNESYSTDWHRKWDTSQTAVYDRYDAMVENFARIVRKEKDNPYPYDYELGLYRLLLKACGDNR